MGETIEALRREAIAWLTDTATGNMATVEDGQPRTRPVSILWREDAVWLTSGTSNGKARQVRRDPRVEMCVPIERGDRNGYVRVAGGRRSSPIRRPARRSPHSFRSSRRSGSPLTILATRRSASRRASFSTFDRKRTRIGRSTCGTSALPFGGNGVGRTVLPGCLSILVSDT